MRILWPLWPNRSKKSLSWEGSKSLSLNIQGILGTLSLVLVAAEDSVIRRYSLGLTHNGNHLERQHESETTKGYNLSERVNEK